MECGAVGSSGRSSSLLGGLDWTDIYIHPLPYCISVSCRYISEDVLFWGSPKYFGLRWKCGKATSEPPAGKQKFSFIFNQSIHLTNRVKSQESRVSPSILKKCWVTVCFLVLLQSIGIWISQNYRTQQASSLKSSKKQKLLIHQIKDQITQESPTVIPHLDFWHYTWSNLFYSLR